MNGSYVAVVCNVLSITLGLVVLGVSMYYTRPRKDVV